MKTTGVVRELDKLGRIVIPKEIRKTLEITEGTQLEFSIDDNSVIMRKCAVGCIFCGGTEELVSFENKNVCEKCIVRLVHRSEQNHPHEMPQEQPQGETQLPVKMEL